jgi:hypothetical protein
VLDRQRRLARPRSAHGRRGASRRLNIHLFVFVVSSKPDNRLNL